MKLPPFFIEMIALHQLWLSTCHNERFNCWAIYSCFSLILSLLKYWLFSLFCVLHFCCYLMQFMMTIVDNELSFLSPFSKCLIYQWNFNCLESWPFKGALTKKFLSCIVPNFLREKENFRREKHIRMPVAHIKSS